MILVISLRDNFFDGSSPGIGICDGVNEHVKKLAFLKTTLIINYHVPVHLVQNELFPMPQNNVQVCLGCLGRTKSLILHLQI